MSRFLSQGGAADGMKMALVALAAALPAGSRIVNTVHDEVVIEAPEAEAEAVCTLTRATMIAAMAGVYPQVPIEVEAHTCAHWGEK